MHMDERESRPRAYPRMPLDQNRTTERQGYGGKQNAEAPRTCGTDKQAFFVCL